MMKKIILGVGVVWGCLFWGATAHAQTIMLGYVDFPPYEFEAQGKPGGILVTIVEALFQKANIPLTLTYLPFKRAYETAKVGEIDGLFNFYKTDERQKFFDYSEPIIQNPLVFFVRRDAVLKYNRLEDLNGLEIGVMRGYTYGTDFDGSTLFKKNAANSHEDNFKRLVFGRISAYPCDKLVGIYVAMSNKIMSELKILPTPLKVMQGRIGFTKDRHREIINKINKVILKMHQSGAIDRITNQYINQKL